MLKIGKVHLPSYDIKDLYVYWSSDYSGFTRIDVIEDIEKYSVVDTSNCLLSYYRKGSEFIIGDVKLLKLLLSIKSTAVGLHTTEKKDVSVVDGKFLMTVKKEAPELGVKYEVITEAGEIKSELYETPNGSINILSVVDSNDSSFTPFNFGNYKPFATLVSSNGLKKSDSAEFYTADELVRKYPDIVHIYDNDYLIIKSYEQAEERLKTWIESKEQLKSYDIESYDVDWGPFSNNKITGVFLGLGEKWSTFFPFRQENFEYNLPIEYLEKIFDAINNQPKYPEVIILGHNLKFEMEGFWQEFKKRVRVDVDTYIMSILLNPVMKKGLHDLKSITTRIEGGKRYLRLDQIFIGKIKFNVLPPDVVLLYGCPDATSPAKIYKNYLQQLPKDEQYWLSQENRLIQVKAIHNEFYGIRLDQQKIKLLIENEQYKINKLDEMFRSIHHTSKNINSYVTIKEILYDRLRCPVEVRTNKGLPATSKAAIDRIIELGTIRDYDKEQLPRPITDMNGDVIIKPTQLAGNKYPSLIIYQAYRKACKELGALMRLKKHSVRDRFMYYINQAGAGSNRQTSDAQQFSDTMKSCALSDSPYHGMVSCDWKQVELRVLPWLAGEQSLIDMEFDPSVDIHRAVASMISRKPMWDISEEERKSVKSTNFGIIYMMSEYGLAIRDFGPSYTKEELVIERNKITDFYNALPHIKKFIKDNEEFVLEKGYIKTAFKYYRYFREILDPTIDEKTKKSAIRSANNTPVQGTAAQMLKLVEISLDNYIHEKGWDVLKDYDGVELPMVRMILPIHDEILLSYDLSISKEEIICMFKTCMELDIDGAPPFFAAPAFINNWYEGKNPTLEVDIELRDLIVKDWNNGIRTFSTDKDDYIDVLINYRLGVIKSYMNDLIAKYKTVDEVAEHIRDDNLTHTIIETLIPDKNDRKKLTHRERIHEAARRYIEKLESDGDFVSIAVAPSTVNDKEDFHESVEDWLSKNSRVDAYGDIIEDELESDELEDTDFNTVSELLPVEDRSQVECHCIYTCDECLINMDGLDIDTTGESIHQGIIKLSDPNQYYVVVYVVNGKLVKTAMKIDYLPKEIESLFQELESEEN